MTHNQGTCPVCNGTKRRPVPADQQRWKTVMSSYDAATDTFACNNCGGQTMFGHPTGLVPLNKEGQPCKHEYTGRVKGRCWTEYTCQHCNHSYDIDSSD